MGKLPHFLLALTTMALLEAVSGFGEACDDDSSCNENNYERCQKFESCSTGVCVCQTGYQLSGGICKKVAAVGQDCDLSTLTGSVCGNQAQCNVQKKCECPSGWEQAGQYGCLPSNRRLEGADCNATNLCFGFGFTFPVTTGLVCSTNLKCSCETDHVWVSNVTYYTSDLSLHSCVHRHAKYGLSEGTRCSRLNTGYFSGPHTRCAAELTCSNCPEESRTASNFQFCVKRAINSGPNVEKSVLSIFAALVVVRLLF